MGHYLNIASISKTFTAIIILQLMEERRLTLNEPIGNFIKDPKIDSVAMNEKNQCLGLKVTVRELLTHKSGLSDYGQNPEFIRKIMTDTLITWTPQTVLDYYVLHHFNKDYNPSKPFRYSDMNYLLLGLIIEKITQQSLTTNYKTRIFNKMKLKGTPYLKYYEPKPEKTIEQDLYWGKKNMQSINFSFEWGAGGLHMIAEDLHTFNESLFDGKFFKRKNTLRQMLRSQPESSLNYSYMGIGLGMYHIKLDPKLEFYGHTGFFKTVICYIPRKKLFLTYSLNQADADHINFLKIIINTGRNKNQ
jgi:D-alanyl-D-alanine carboxypeptidase